MEVGIKTKICNDKDCLSKGQEQPLENFGSRASAKDGLNPKCKACISRWQRFYADQRKNGIKESKITRNAKVGWDTQEQPKDERLVNALKPVYSYFKNTPVKDKVLQLDKSLGEIIQFFDIPQRATMEALLHFIIRVDGTYRWDRKMSLDELVEKVIELIPNGSLKKEPHNSIIYEQVAIFSERLLAMERKVDLLINSLIGENND